MKTIVTFSGGVDSTYILWKLLSETADEVTAVFVNVSQIDPAWKSRYDLRTFTGTDPAVCSEAINWLQTNVRSFTFVNQPFDVTYVIRGISNANSPQTYIARYAAPRINVGEFDRLVCTSEKENDGWSNGGSIDTRRPGAMAAKEVFLANATRGTIEFPLIASNYTQANALSEMPSDLLNIVDHCTLEDNSYKCQKKRWFQNLLDQGKTTQEAYNIWYAKCTSYNDKWFSMKWWIDDIQPDESNTWPMPQWPT
jgi:hypothetical protein